MVLGRVGLGVWYAPDNLWFYDWPSQSIELFEYIFNRAFRDLADYFGFSNFPVQAFYVVS